MAKPTIPPVSAFMTEAPCTVDCELSLSDGRERMSLNRIRHLLVTKNDQLIGMVSARDLDFAAGFAGPKAAKTKITAAIHGNPYTCPAETTIDAVAAEMETHRYGSVAVTDEGRVVGVFTTVDALRALRELATGEKAERLNGPTHVVDQTEEGLRHSGTHVADSLRSHRASPSPNDGSLGG